MKHGIQKMIAVKADVSPAFINAIIRRNKRPSWKTAKRLASATDTDPILWLEGSQDDIRAAINQMSTMENEK